MLFNSTVFIFVFLPITLGAYYLVSATWLRSLRLPLLIVATILFYAWAGPKYTILLLGSVLTNYVFGLLIAHAKATERSGKMWLVTGIAFNVSLLGYFKYFNFFVQNISDAFGLDLHFARIALPLAISFFSFQQIGFLVDLFRGRIALGRPLEYAAFVLFFPQLLAGPIIQYKELVPQLVAPPRMSAATRNILIGLTIFAIGLFKKTVIADTAALYSLPVIDGAHAGTAPDMISAWIAAITYTLQVYFDFSGYSDMAIGVARMFGIVLPLNFHSPLRSTSIVELWRRWHITLGRWVQSYVFQPLSIPLARFAGGKAPGKYGMLAFSVLIPTMVSMLIVGIWHGAGWPFVIFGLMQGSYMVVNELWAAYRRKIRKTRKGVEQAWRIWAKRIITFLFFVVSVVPFASPDLATLLRLLGSMAGFGAGDLSPAIAEWPFGMAGALGTLAIVLLITFAAPNTQQIMARTDPVLEWPKWHKIDSASGRIEWRPTTGWAILSGATFFLAVAFIMRGTTKFIYFNF